MSKVVREIKVDEKEKVTSGWDAITERCEQIYPNQKNPMHYGPLIMWKLGGNSPLDGISIYDGGDYWHFVTYGLSELYNKESDNLEYSGYGMEFTLKLKKGDYDLDKEIKNICGVLQQIARVTFTDGELFRPNEFLYTGQEVGIDCEKKSNITGFITVLDDKFQVIDTPNGEVSFVEFIGVTLNEIEAVKNKKMSVLELFKELKSDVTDYNRNSLI